MQISRRFLLASVTAAVLVPSIPFAQDTPAQIHARQVLEEQLKGSQPQPPTQNPSPTSAPAKPAAPVPAPSQPMLASDQVPLLNAPKPSSPEEIEQARKALRQKLSAPAEPSAAPTPVPPPVAVTPSAPAPTAPTAPTPPPAQVASPTDLYQPLPEPPNPEAIAKAREALQEKFNALNASTTTEEFARKPQERRKNTLQVFAPLHGPPIGLSASKQERLHSLLQQYQADQITPEQYHVQRAQILAEP